MDEGFSGVARTWSDGASGGDLVSFFVYLSHTARKDHEDKFYAMRPASLATAMQRMMIAAGIPEDFTAHSARHAGMAAGKASGMHDDELCARSNMSSTTYKKYYHRQVRHKVSEPSVGLKFFSERVG